MGRDYSNDFFFLITGILAYLSDQQSQGSPSKI